MSRAKRKTYPAWDVVFCGASIGDREIKSQTGVAVQHRHGGILVAYHYGENENPRPILFSEEKARKLCAVLNEGTQKRSADFLNKAKRPRSKP